MTSGAYLAAREQIGRAIFKSGESERYIDELG